MIRRFAIQEHTVSPGERHYDLLIEDAGVLVTFQLEAPPGPAPVGGSRSFDHRLRYLSYEGEIGGGRGRVALWDRGEAVDEEGDPRAARYAVRLHGERLRGRFVLERAADAVACRPLPGAPA